jgi:hypothetical protein
MSSDYQSAAFDKAANGRFGYGFTVSRGRAALYQRASLGRLFTILSRASSPQPMGSSSHNKGPLHSARNVGGVLLESCCGALGILGIYIHPV